MHQLKGGCVKLPYYNEIKRRYVQGEPISRQMIGTLISMIENGVRPQPSRTLDQNAFYWAFLQGLATEIGWDPKAIHEVFKRRFLRGKSTKSLTIGEMETYIFQVLAFCGHLGYSGLEKKRGTHGTSQFQEEALGE